MKKLTLLLVCAVALLFSTVNPIYKDTVYFQQSLILGKSGSTYANIIPGTNSKGSIGSPSYHFLVAYIDTIHYLGFAFESTAVYNIITLDTIVFKTGARILNPHADTIKFREKYANFTDDIVVDSNIVAQRITGTVTDNTAAIDETRYQSFIVNATHDPAGNAGVTGLYSTYNWSAGTNGVFTANGIEGVARSTAADEAGTFRGGYFRTYTSAGATATMRTAIGCEMSARAGYLSGTDCVAENGTAFVGARIWMAPYFTSGSLANINNFWGLWIYGEHSTQRNGDAAIKISTAGGGFTDDIILQNGAKITNPNGYFDIAGGIVRPDTFQLPIDATSSNGSGPWATCFVDTTGTDSLIIMVGSVRRGIAIE